MGTTVLHREKGQTAAAFFAEEFGEAYAKAVRATASKPGVFFAVVEVPAAEKQNLVPDENGMVRYCWVVRTGHGDGRRALANFSYAEQTEFMGPLEANCPVRLLDMLSPIKDDGRDDTPSAWARGWRRKCRDRAALDAALVVGAEFTLDQPLRFSDKVEADRFRLVERKGATLSFRRTIDGMRVRLAAHQIADLKAVA